MAGTLATGDTPAADGFATPTPAPPVLDDPPIARQRVQNAIGRIGMAATVLDRAAESVRTLSRGSLCPGCERPFTPRRANQRHCPPSCPKLTERKSEASRWRALLERLDPCDPGRPE
jgi:hypothetical protein